MNFHFHDSRHLINIDVVNCSCYTEAKEAVKKELIGRYWAEDISDEMFWQYVLCVSNIVRIDAS